MMDNRPRSSIFEKTEDNWPKTNDKRLSVELPKSIFEEEPQSKQKIGSIQVIEPDEIFTPSRRHSSIAFIRDLKKYYSQKRKKCRRELSKLTDNIKQFEKKLHNISRNCSRRWSHLQSKILFLSLIRRSLRTTRKFGIEPLKVKMGLRLLHPGCASTKKFVLYPNTRLVKVHSFCMVIIISYLIILFPLNIPFEVDRSSRLYMNCTIITYMYLAFDLFLSFFSAYYLNGKIVDDLKCIVSNRLSVWLLVDFIKLVPLDLLASHPIRHINALLKLPRLLLVLTAAFQSGSSSRFSSLFGKIRHLFSSNKSVHLVKTLLFIFVFVHVTACIWILMLSFNTINWADR
jgi:hypothetical protein